MVCFFNSIFEGVLGMPVIVRCFSLASQCVKVCCMLGFFWGVICDFFPSFVLIFLFSRHRINVGPDPYRKGSITGN